MRAPTPPTVATDVDVESGQGLGVAADAAALPGLTPPSPDGLGLSAAAANAGTDWQRLLPRFWFQNSPTDREWDAVLSRALDLFPVTQRTRYTVGVGPLAVWIGNWPYSFGTCDDGIGGIPTVRTRIRLRDMIIQKRLAELDAYAAAQTPQVLS